jgi:hypothetical protein
MVRRVHVRRRVRVRVHVRVVITTPPRGRCGEG